MVRIFCNMNDNIGFNHYSNNLQLKAIKGGSMDGNSVISLTNVLKRPSKSQKIMLEV